MSCWLNIRNTKIESKITSDRVPLRSYLEEVGQDQSFENLNSLLELFEDENDKMVSFIGAGIAKPLGVGDWSELMRKLMAEAGDDLQQRYPGLVEKESENEHSNSSIVPEEYPKIAEEIFEVIGPENFTRVVSEFMEPTINRTTPTLQNLVLAVKVHLTTNFARYIEATYNSLEQITRAAGGEFARNLDIKSYDEASDYPSIENPDWLCYLHGKVSDGIIILREQEYNRVYKHVGGASEVHDCLKHFYDRFHLLFIGFSFEDIFVKGCIDHIAAELEQSSEIYRKQKEEYGKKFYPRKRKHFLLIDSSSANSNWHEKRQLDEAGARHGDNRNYFDDWQKIGIHPIVYKPGRHVFLEDLFTIIVNDRVNNNE